VQLLAAMPPLRRSIDLAETCAFLEEVAAASPAARRPKVVEVEPEALRTDLPMSETAVVRGLVACSVCDAPVAQRCRDTAGISAYVHDARVRAALG